MDDAMQEKGNLRDLEQRLRRGFENSGSPEFSYEWLAGEVHKLLVEDRAGTIRDFLDWLMNEPHGHGDEVVGLWKGADATGMTNWSPNPTALAYDYLGIDPQTGEPTRT